MVLGYNLQVELKVHSYNRFRGIVAEETESDSNSDSESIAFLAGLGYQNKINTFSKTSGRRKFPLQEEIDFH